ncbi:hypothetical protein JCM5350_002987 [Sporobolomyces pararoseus]
MSNAAAEATLLRRLTSIKHVLLVLSGKGGVGKSSVSVQMALSLLASDPKLKIGLLDVDLTGPSLPRMLGIEGKEVLSSRDGWVPVYLDTGEEEGGKLACMSIGFLLKNSKESVVWRGPKKNAMIKQFLGQVSWGELDYLIIDTPPGTSDEHISLLETLRPLLVEPPADSPPLPTLSSLLVSTPQALALLDVSKELSFVRRTKLPLLGLIENMSGYVCPHCGDVVGIFGQGGGESFCKLENEKQGDEYEGGCRFLGRVPIDRELVALLDDVAENGNAGLLEEGETRTPRPQRGEEGKKTLVERYREIPSFKVVKSLAEDVKKLIEEQREKGDNSFTAGVDPVPQREPIHVDFTMNKEGEPICKAHKNADCKSCYNFKKQLVKLTKEGQKKAKQDKKNNPVSNLFQ